MDFAAELAAQAEQVDYLVIGGPTASGKTALALALAAKVDCEIVSADSRQVYRHMTIGTAKPSRAELASVPHHFIDERDPDQTWSAGMFFREARQRITAILGRGKVPVVVGGAGLYIQALQEGLFGGGAVPESVRQAVEQRLAEQGEEALYQELKTHDPDYAANFHFHDQKKLMRAFEIKAQSGYWPSEAHRLQNQRFAYSSRTIIVDRPRPVLYERINARVDAMLAAGLVAECKMLQSLGYGLEHYPVRTIGYKEIFAFMAGQISLDEAREAMAQQTRNFAKRQLTWFRNHPYDTWWTLET